MLKIPRNRMLIKRLKKSIKNPIVRYLRERTGSSQQPLVRFLTNQEPSEVGLDLRGGGHTIPQFSLLRKRSVSVT